MMTIEFDFSIFPVLETERLILRRFDQSDAPTLNELFSSIEVLEFSSSPPMNSISEAIKLIEKYADTFKEKMGVQWSITLKSDNSFIGTCGCYDFDQKNQNIDIGFLLLPTFWGKGYATEVTLAMIKWIFETLNLHRIQADCTKGHVASEKVLLKCGFTEEGIWRESSLEHGKFVDVKQFGLLHREFIGFHS